MSLFIIFLFCFFWNHDQFCFLLAISNILSNVSKWRKRITEQNYFYCFYDRRSGVVFRRFDYCFLLKILLKNNFCLYNQWICIFIVDSLHIYWKPYVKFFNTCIFFFYYWFLWLFWICHGVINSWKMALKWTNYVQFRTVNDSRCISYHDSFSVNWVFDNMVSFDSHIICNRINNIS